jgi:hypothetical protein
MSESKATESDSVDELLRQVDDNEINAHTAPKLAALVRAMRAAQGAPQLTPLDLYVRQVAGTIMSGVAARAADFGIPPQMMMLCFVREMGRIVASSVAGDLVNVLKFRKALREIFADGVSNAEKPQPLPEAPAQPQTAVRP